MTTPERLLTSDDYADDRPDGYFERKIAALKAGQATWLRLNFDGDGMVIELRKGKERLGMVVADSAMGFDASAYVFEGPEPVPVDDSDSTESNPSTLPAAAFLVEQFWIRRGEIRLEDGS